MQIIHDFGEVLLGFVLTGHVRKLDALRGFHVHLRVGFARAEHHGVRTAHFLHHLLGEHLPQANKNHNGQHPAEQKAQNGRHLLLNFAGELRPVVIQALGQFRVAHQAGLVHLLVVLVGKEDLVVLQLHLADVVVVGHLHEGVVIHFFDLPLTDRGHDQHIKQQKKQNHDTVIGDEGFLGCFYLIHEKNSILYGAPACPAAPLHAAGF